MVRLGVLETQPGLFDNSPIFSFSKKKFLPNLKIRVRQNIEKGIRQFNSASFNKITAPKKISVVIQILREALSLVTYMVDIVSP